MRAIELREKENLYNFNLKLLASLFNIPHKMIKEIAYNLENIYSNLNSNTLSIEDCNIIQKYTEFNKEVYKIEDSFIKDVVYRHNITDIDKAFTSNPICIKLYFRNFPNRYIGRSEFNSESHIELSIPYLSEYLNDQTNQYQDKRNENPSDNSVGDLYLQTSGVPYEALEIIEEMFTAIPKQVIDGYGGVHVYENGIMECHVTYSLNRYYPEYGDVESVKTISSEFIIADYGSDSYSDLSDNEDWSKVIAKCNGSFNLNNGNGFYVKINSEMEPEGAYAEAQHIGYNADNFSDFV